MTVEEAIERKAQAERQIAEIISAFMSETGLAVDDVELSRLETTSVGGRRTYAVSRVQLNVLL